MKMKESNKMSIYILGCAIIGMSTGYSIDSKVLSVVALLALIAVWLYLFFIRKGASK